MSLKMPQWKTIFWLILILFTILLAACGGAAAEPSASNGNAAAGADLQEWLNSQGTNGLDALPGAGVAADVVTPAPTPTRPVANTAVSTPNTAEIASQTTDANGITIGFTADGRPFKGNPDAPILIEEFSDYQCPFCARWAAQTMSSLVANQIADGQVMLVYYDFPLSSIHPQAAAAANAARCAGEEGAEAYWQYHDILFARVGEWSISNPATAFVRFAGELGLDEADFTACVNSNRYSSQVQADVQLGQSRGVSSTPSFFLNEQALIGAQPTEVFNQAITALLNGESIAEAQPQAQPQEIVIPTPAAIALGANDIAFALGDPNAPVQIVEFTDYQCPYCQQHSAQTLPQIVQEMVENGRVYYVFKDFPLDIHPEARVAAKAVRCGGEQDAFMEMHDAVFNSQEQWGGQGESAGDVFAMLAADLGLDGDTFATCYASSDQDDLVQANFEEAIALGVRSTPSFFFNGYLASGAMPFDSFEQIVTWGEKGELAAQVEANIRAAYAAQQAQQQQQQVPPTPAGPVDVPTDDVAFAIGSPDAPITIVEYTDYQCPFCSRHFAQTYPQLKEQYVDTGLVRYVFKDFPLTSIHPQAVLAAEAARCAGEQNAYLEMHDALFANQNEWNGRQDAATLFTNYARQIGLEPTPFAECLESGRYQQAVEADLNEGIAFGVRGTPTFFINGHIFVGAQ
ncbi:MAG TPA: thioredoxin domain-containing protein, partial [Chloroflexota bacterium]|nr:thioredoxin domain-containing protein [Chloroflexota bacterium]